MVTAKPVGNNFCGVWRTAQGAALQPRVINRSEPYWPLARTVWPTEASVQGGDNRMEKLLLTVWEAADVLSVSRSRVYELLYAEQPVWTRAGRCPSKAHDREHLGIGGRRVLVSRDWSGKTLSEHRADRSAVVREALQSAGMAAPDLERMATDVLSPDGLPRYVWTDERPDPTTYTLMLLRAVAERQRWRAQYDQAKTRTAVETVDSLSAIGPPSGGGPPSPSVAHSSASPDNPPNPGPQDRQSRVSAANPQDRSEATALDGRAGGPTFTTRGRPSPSTQSQANADRRRTGDDHDHE